MSITNISKCDGCQSIRKELDESNGGNEDRAARKTYFDCSDEKRTLDYVCEIQGIIDKDLSKPIRSITGDM